MRELKTRFDGHWTGIVWMFGEPLLQLAAFMAINIYLRGRTGGESYDFAVSLLVAMIPFKLSQGLWAQLMSAPKANKGLFNYRQVKPLDTLIARALLEFALDLGLFLVVMVVCVRLGYKPAFPANPLGYIWVWVQFVLLGMGIGLFLASIAGLIPRLSVAVSLMSMPMMIFSGVIFPLHGVPLNILYWIEIFNPMMHLVQYARSTYIAGYPILQGVTPAIPICYTIVFWALGMVLYRLRRFKLAAGE